jgi:hypothetical protein
MPNGALPAAWTPTAEGSSFPLSPTLEPLSAVRQKVLVLTQLWNARSDFGEGHYVKTAGLLTGEAIRMTGGKDLRNGISVDQLAAQHVGRQTRLPSLELGTEPVRHIVDMGFSTVYGGHVSWRTPTTPAPKELSPRRAFDRLFRSFGLDRRALSVLDVVREDARRLRRDLGRTDRAKLDEYLDSVRALETRIDAFTRKGKDTSKEAALVPPEKDPRDHEVHVRLMLELMVTAFATGATRVATFMFGNAVSGRDFTFLDGVRGGHHELSHHENRAEKIEQYQRINRWHVAQLAWMLERMDAIRVGNHSLLDDGLVLFASGLSDGNRHDPHDLPVLLCGGGGGRLRSGRHVRFEKDSRLCDLHLTLLRCLDVDVDRFGDSRGVLREILRGA